MKKNGSSSSLMNYDASVFVPYNYAKTKLVSGGGRNSVRIIALVNDVSNVTVAIDDVTTILRTQHGLGKIHRPLAASRIMLSDDRLHALAAAEADDPGQVLWLVVGKPV